MVCAEVTRLYAKASVKMLVAWVLFQCIKSVLLVLVTLKK
jgi:hypothetical protein